MEYETAGDPISGLKWTRKTTEKISEELCLFGIKVGTITVGKILKKLGFSLKINSKKTSYGGKIPTVKEQAKRDSQFKYIKKIRKKFETNKLPAISCDTKKRN